MPSSVTTRIPPSPVRGATPGRALLAVCIVQFMVSLDLSVVNVGLPQISSALGFGGADVTWVIHAYALAFGGLLLLGGRLADLFGHRNVLVGGLALFAFASLVGGFATSAGWLLAARFAQGIGAAAAAPAALAALTQTFPSGRPRAKAFGAWSAMNAAGGALGVLIGGVLTEFAGWRWVLFVSVPMALVALVFARVGIAAKTRTTGSRPGTDLLGGALVTAGLLSVVFGILSTERSGWTSPFTLVPLALGVAFVAGFVVAERNARGEPLLRLGLLANRNVAGANIYNLMFGAAMASAFYFVSLYLQRVLGHGPARTGVEFLPFALAVVAGAALAVKASSRVDNRGLMILGGVVSALGFGAFGFISAEGSFVVHVLGPSLVAGTGLGLCLGPVVSTATAGVDESERGVASGVLSSSRQIGAALGLAVLGTFAANRSARVDAAPADALAHGYSLGLLGAGAFFFLAVITALFLIPKGPAPADDPTTSGSRRHQ